MSDLGETKAAKTYTGGCHCGNVKFEATTALEGAMECNCSICAKAGWVVAFVPAEQFKLLSGEASLTDYQFGKKNVHHTFCSTCGVRSFSHAVHSGHDMRAVNVRCLEGVDLSSLKIGKFDGASV